MFFAPALELDGFLGIVCLDGKRNGVIQRAIDQASDTSLERNAAFFGELIEDFAQRVVFRNNFHDIKAALKTTSAVSFRGIVAIGTMDGHFLMLSQHVR